MYCVYKHTAPNGKVYIGVTKQIPTERWQRGLGYRTQQRFYRAIQKYGWGNFVHEVLFDGLTQEEAERIEIDLIRKYQSNDKNYGYNIESGGNFNKEISEETRQKLREINLSDESLTRVREINRKRWADPEEHKKMSERFSGKNNPMYGRKIPEKQRQAMIEGLRNSPKCFNQRGERASFYGKHHTEESKAKMAAANMGGKSYRARKVVCVETGKTYPCIKDAYRETGINFSSISKCCVGKAKTAGGYHWNYVEKEV